MSEVENPVEQLVPKGEYKKYKFGLDGHLEYVQKPLSFFGKIELFSILGSAVEKALSSGGTSLGELLSDAPSGEFGDADQFILTISKLAQYAPEFLQDVYVISLGVPSGEREYVKSVMVLQEEAGGLTDDQGIQILETFVEQNWSVMVDFFTKRVLPLVNQFTNSAPESPSSKPSKVTRPRTQKA